jgi:hypothetical protein
LWHIALQCYKYHMTYGYTKNTRETLAGQAPYAIMV